MCKAQQQLLFSGKVQKLLNLKGGYRKFFYSFISPIGHNIWWENSRNRSFGPKNDPKMQIWPFLGHFQAQNLEPDHIFPPYIMPNGTYERIKKLAIPSL